MKPYSEKSPLVYSCSGCSNVAQLANRIAISLDREGFAEMSCISGVGGNVKPIVNKAKSGRPIIAIDGCPLACVKNCLSQHQIEAEKHYELTALSEVINGFDVKKRYQTDCSDDEFEKTKQFICQDFNNQATYKEATTGKGDTT